MVSIFSALQPKELDTKTESEKSSYLEEKWIFTGRIEAGSVTGMINKEILAQYI